MSGFCHKYTAINKCTGQGATAKATDSEDAYEQLLKNLGYEIIVEEM